MRNGGRESAPPNRFWRVDMTRHPPSRRLLVHDPQASDHEPPTAGFARETQVDGEP
jgi:hypothetical protein